MSLLSNYNQAPPLARVSVNAQLKMLMSEQSYSFLKGMMTWGVVYEELRKGNTVEWSDEVREVMMAPYTFFGQNMEMFKRTASQVVPVLSHGIMQYESDPVYAAANPMPWIVLQTVAPMLAQFDFGPQAMKECMGVVTQLHDKGELPD